MSSVPLFANERIATCETPAAVPALHNSVGRLEAEPVVKDENGPDRRNDEAKYDAPAPTEQNEKMDLDELRWILDVHLEDLPPQQHEVVVQTFTEGRKRPEVAA